MIAVLLIGLAPSMAVAEARAPAVALRHADLDLRDEADAREMLRRIHAAALRVCAASETSHAAILQAQACRREAAASGVSRLNAPAVTAAYKADPSARTLAWRR